MPVIPCIFTFSSNSWRCEHPSAWRSSWALSFHQLLHNFQSKKLGIQELRGSLSAMPASGKERRAPKPTPLNPLWQQKDFPYKIPRTMGWGVPCRALMHATSPLQGIPLDTSPPSLPFARHLPRRWCHTHTSFALHYSFPEKGPARSAPWWACSSPGSWCIPAAVCRQLAGTWDRVRLGEVRHQRQ